MKGLHEQIAAAHGLAPDAAKFLTGSTVAEVERNAVALAQLLSSHAEQREPESVAGPSLFADSAKSRAEKRRELAALFAGRTAQPRDETGRYVSRSGSFDGGARANPPAPQSPEQAHAELLGELFAASRTFRGTGF